MPVNAPTIWRVRPDGNTLFGAGYDGVSYGSGVDYTDQASPVLSLTDLVGNGTTTLTSATGGFTSAMRGNAINITSGAGATVGFYFIADVASTNSVTIDRSPGTFTGGVGRVGGAWGGGTTNPLVLADNSRATGNKPVAGNTVLIRGSGSDSPSSADYTFTGFVTAVSGDATSGHIRFSGYNGRPWLSCNGLWSFQGSNQKFDNLRIRATSNNLGVNGLFFLGSFSQIENCELNLNLQAGLTAITMGASCSVLNCWIHNGSNSPTSSTEPMVKINQMNTLGYRLVGNLIEFSRSDGISATVQAGGVISGNVIRGCVGSGLVLSETTFHCAAFGNTIHGNSVDGIRIGGLSNLVGYDIWGNILSGHTGSGRFGLNVAAGSAAAVSAMRRLIGYNAYFNNTAHRSSNLGAGAGDVTLTADPYVNASAGDFRLNATAGGGAALRGLGFPTLIGTYPQSTGGTRVGFPDIGAIQHEDAGGGGGSTRTIFMGGAF